MLQAQAKTGPMELAIEGPFSVLPRLMGYAAGTPDIMDRCPIGG